MLNFFKNNFYFRLFFIFIISFLFFTILQFSFSDFLCPDSYFHVKMALLMKDKLVLRDFPWLQFTVLKDHFADHHFLFHLFLIPAVSIPGINPIIGAKGASGLFVAIAFVCFFYILERNKIKLSFLWTIILLISSSAFIFRMLLVRAPSLSLIALLFGFYLMVKQRHFWLAVLSFFYVWLYGGFFFIFILALIYAFVYSLSYKRLEWKVPLASFLGILAGILLHPYFPNLLYFLKIQIFQSSFFTSKIAGAEWMPLEFLDFLKTSFLAFITYVFAISFLFIKSIHKKRLFSAGQAPALVLLFFSIFLYFLTARSQRFIEIWHPFSILFAAYIFWEPLVKLKKANPSYFFRKFLPIYSFILLFSFAFYNVKAILESTRSNIEKFKEYQTMALWLKDNTSSGSVIFNISFSDFPPLFYFNDQNYYGLGLDPVFTYAYDKELYKKLENLWRGEDLEKVYHVFKNDFKVTYVLVGQHTKELKNYLDNDERFRKIYEKGKLSLYQL